jgi:hypothetical protein
MWWLWIGILIFMQNVGIMADAMRVLVVEASTHALVESTEKKHILVEARWFNAFRAVVLSA